MRPLPAGEDPHRRRPAVQLVPVRAFAQQPGQLGDVRFFGPAPSMRAGPVRAGGSGPALAYLPALIDRDLPGLRRDQPDRGPLPGAELPADGVGQLVPGPGRQLIKAGDQPVAGPGPVRGHHQPPPELRRQRRDRVTENLQVISGRVRPGAAPAHHPGQRLTGVIAVPQQRVMPEALEIRLRQLLIRMRRDDRGVQPDAGHALQDLIRDPHAGQGAVAGLNRRPRLAAGAVHRPGDPGQRPRAARGDLIERPPRRGHRGDQAEQLFLVGQHPEVADHLAAISDRAGQVRRHPPAVVDQQPGRGQRPRQPPGQPGLIR